jgi:hypothetical protein
LGDNYNLAKKQENNNNWFHEWEFHVIVKKRTDSKAGFVNIPKYNEKSDRFGIDSRNVRRLSIPLALGGTLATGYVYF